MPCNRLQNTSGVSPTTCLRISSPKFESSLSCHGLGYRTRVKYLSTAFRVKISRPVTYIETIDWPIFHRMRHPDPCKNNNNEPTLLGNARRRCGTASGDHCHSLDIATTVGLQQNLLFTFFPMSTWQALKPTCSCLHGGYHCLYSFMCVFC